LISVQGERLGFSSVFFMKISSFPSNICWSGFLKLYHMFWVPLFKIRWVDSYSVPLVFMSVSVLVSCCFYCYGSVV
jgi:hypothetical protein